MASNFDDDMSYGSDLENINDDDDSSYEEAINDDGNFPEDYKGEEIMTNNGGVNINDKRVVDFQNRKMKKMAKEMSLLEKKLEELTQQNSELQVQNKQLEREKLFNETKADELHDTLNALKNHEVHDALMSKSLQLAEVLTDSDMLRAQVRDMQKERDAEKSKLIGLSVVVRSLQSLASQNEEDEEDLDSEEESEEIVLTAESALDMTLKNMKFQIEDLEEERQRLATKCKEQSATIESMTKQNEMYEVKVEMLEELFRSFNEERTKTEEPTNNEGRPSQAKTESPPSPPIKSEAPSSASSYKCSVCGAAASAIEGAADTVSKETIAARCAPIKNPTTPRNPGLSSDALSVDTDESETEKDTGIFLQSESKVVLREVIKAESDDDEAAAVRPGDNGTTTSLSNGGGFAVLQQQDVTVFIKKVSRTEQSRFIKSGDTVMFKMVRGGGTGETRYLSLHRGWWLKWVSSPPGKNSSFNIYAQNEPQFGEQMPDFLTMGASFTLRHKRWSDYLVGVSQDPSTAYGGRMLGLYKSEDDEQEDEDQYTSDEGEMDLEGNGQQFDFQSTKTGRMKPLVLCAHYPNGSLLDRSFNNSPMKSPKSLVSPSNLPAPGLDKKLLFSDIHSEADVPAWIEMMNRTERTTQLTYVLRIVHREPKEDGEEKEDSVLPGPSEQEPYSFSKLRAGRELARVLLIGQNKKKEKRARRGSMFGASTHSCERRVERRGSMLGNSTHSGKNSWFDLSMRSFDDDDLSSESSSDDGSVDSFADDNSDDYLSVDFSIESAEFTGTLKSVDDFSDSYTTNNNTQKSYETFNNSKGSTQKSFESFGKEDDESSSESESESENEPANEPANESVHSPRGRAAPERWGMISRSKSENPSYFPRGRAPLEGQVESELADESGHSPRGRAPPERRGLVKHKSMETELANESGHTPRGQRRGGLVKQNSIMRFGKAAKNKVVGTGKFAAKTVKETAKTTGKLTRDTVVGTGKLAAKTVKETGKLTKNTMKETGKHVKGTIKEAARGGLKVAKGTVKAAKVVSAIPGKPKAKKREKSPLGVKIEVAKDMYVFIKTRFNCFHAVVISHSIIFLTAGKTLHVWKPKLLKTRTLRFWPVNSVNPKNPVEWLRASCRACRMYRLCLPFGRNTTRF